MKDNLTMKVFDDNRLDKGENVAVLFCRGNQITGTLVYPKYLVTDMILCGDIQVVKSADVLTLAEVL